VAAAVAAVAAAADPLAARVFRDCDHQQLGESHQKVAQCREHGDRPARDHAHDPRLFPGSHQDHISYLAWEYHPDESCGQCLQDCPAMDWTVAGLAQLDSAASLTGTSW